METMASWSNPTLPPVFRVLIVDDQIGQDDASKEQVRNTIDYWARKASNWRSDLVVEVEFEGSSVDGFNRWCNEVFDVTLIDSDFRKNIEPPEKGGGFDLSKSVTNTSHQGFEVLRLILDKEKPSSGKYEEVFAYREEANQIYLWSALPYKPSAEGSEAHPSELGTLFRRYGLAEDDPRKSALFIPKLHMDNMAGVPRSVESVVTDGVKRLLDDPTSLTPAQQLERVLYFLSRSALAGQAASFLGKFVFRDDVNKYPQLTALGAAEQGGVLRISERLPKSLAADAKWLPLHGGVAGRHGLTGAVRYMLGLTSNPAMEAEYKKRRDDCVEDEQLRRPRYPMSPRCSDDEKTTVLGREFKNPFFAAATPFTGTTVVGEENALAAMKEKVKALLNGPFGAVILKTTYLDYNGQWENVHWPAIQMQSHMRTRCLFPPSGTSTIWNTGRTAMEMFPPRLLQRFLRELFQDEDDLYVDEPFGKAPHRVIVSLGSKFTLPRDWSRLNPGVSYATLKGIWDRLFQDVFGSGEDAIDEAAFPIVEVNVRHTLREMVKRQGRGDEYLFPLELDGDDLDLQDPVLSDFLQWLQVIHEVAVTHKKELIIKLPHRSDVFAFIKCAIWVRQVHLDSAPLHDRPFGVRALTLINTIKSPVWPVVARDRYRQSWYASPTAWGDGADKLSKYQMSGALLSAHRSQILAPLLERREQLGDIEIIIGGGITDHTVLDLCLQDTHSALTEGKSTVRRGAVQIGTWALLSMRLDSSSWKQATVPHVSGDGEDPADFEISGCQGCSDCSLENPPDHDKYLVRPADKGRTRTARLRRKPRLTVDQIRSRLQGCRNRSVRLQRRIQSEGAAASKIIPSTNEIRPRFAWLDQTRCRTCGSCGKTFYCDAFLDRKHEGLLPVFEPRHCTGCGLCAQICPHSALHLYEPKEYLVVVSHSKKIKDYLTAIGIPHMYFHATEDLARIPMSDDGMRTILVAAANGNQEQAANLADRAFTMESLLKERLKNAHALGRGGGRKYTDDRERLLKSAGKDFIKGTPNIEKARTLIWSLLLWSDPGQVLWESPIVTVRASGKKADITQQGKFITTVNADEEEALWEQLLELEAIQPVLDALDARRSSVRDRI